MKAQLLKVAVWALQKFLTDPDLGDIVFKYPRAHSTDESSRTQLFV